MNIRVFRYFSGTPWSFLGRQWASITGMKTLSAHYARLLGIDESWRVEAVDLRLEERQVEIRLSHSGSDIFCPECGRSCGLADHAAERRWRHLDTMRFTTELVARLPRCRCPEQKGQDDCAVVR